MQRKTPAPDPSNIQLRKKIIIFFV